MVEGLERGQNRQSPHKHKKQPKEQTLSCINFSNNHELQTRRQFESSLWQMENGKLQIEAHAG